MSHLLCPISRQPVQFCESAACLFFSWGFFLFDFDFDFFFLWWGGCCLCSEKSYMGVGTVCLCMNAFESNLFKKGFSERTSLYRR